MFEFDPKVKLTFEEVLAMQNEPAFSFFEPYGLRFHASLDDIRPFESRFNIRPIKPSLEDVFIRLIEGKT